MPTRKTSSSKSRTTSSKTSTGKKEMNSRGQSKTTKSSSLKSKTQQNLKKNQQCLTTTGTQSKKTKSTNTSTAKAKVKNTNTSKTQQKKPSVKRTTRQKHKDPGIKYSRSKDLKLFPWVQTFPWRLDDRKENKVCHFQCLEHATKYILRYNYAPKHYKLTCHTSVPNG